MNCPRCDASLAADARFCGVCGASVPSPSNAYDSSTIGDATMLAYPAQGPQGIAVTQQNTPAGWHGVAPQGQTPAPAQGSFWPPQGMPVQATQEVAWPQPSQQPWPPQSQQPWPQSGVNYAPATLAHQGTSKPPKRRRRIGLRLLLSLVILLAVLAGAWFFGLRPYLHNFATTQLDQALTDAQVQLVILQAALPSGPQSLNATENDLNSYLSARDTNQLQNLHITITPENLQLSFQVDGLNSTILALPVAVKGALQVQNVQVEGVLAFIMSSDELTADLNAHFETIGQQMHRTINTITLKAHVLSIQLS